MISIIVPVYQTESYIEKCMKSLYNQTCHEFEVILVDDGTKDASIQKAVKILENGAIRYSICAEKDRNGNVINKGLACARNLGIKNASGDWILCIDSDDYIHPKTIEIFSYLIEKNNASLFICEYKNVIEEFSLNNYLEGETADYNIERIDRKELLHKFFARKMRVVIPTILVKKTFLEKYHIEYPMDSRYSEDQIYLWKVFMYSKTAIYIHKVLYFYVHRANSIMTSASLKQIISGYESGRRSFDEFRDIAIKELKDGNIDFNYDAVVARWILGLSHSGAMLLEYDDFCVFLDKMKYKKEIIRLLKHGEMKTVFATMLLLLNKKLYYKVAKRSLKNYCDVDKE